MPRPRKINIETRINELVTDHINGLVSTLAAEIRRNLAEEIKDYLGGTNGASGRGAGRIGRVNAPRKRRIRPCIAPGCKNASKGPRFHYLCDQHKNASKKDYEAWRRAKQQRSAA